MKACRGSVEIVTGMPWGVVSASACRALLHRAAERGSPSACTLKWLRCLSQTTVLVGDLLMAPACSISDPSAPASMTVWNIRPTFSSRESRPSRSSTRSSTGSWGSS
jgi:hypothetical protein